MEPKIKKKIKVFLLVIFLNLISCSPSQGEDKINLGVWVSVFSKQRPLYSKDAAAGLIDFCNKAGINEIYLQLYQSGKAYYDTQIADRVKYEEMIKSAGIDTVDFLIKEAQKNNIKVFAWVNILSLGQNEGADIINIYGDEVLTRDQYLRPSFRSKYINESDKYYLREDQIFLEPGDQRVVKYLILVVEEIVKRYPSLSGIHLDYIRYPLTVPFVPSSKFNKFGLIYGYGTKNVQRFKDATGINPLTDLNNEEKAIKWDNWKRQQVNSLVRRIYRHLKAKSAQLLVSCAVVPAPERAYSSLYQDWLLWLEEGIADYVILMNYSPDNQLIKETVRSVSCLGEKERVSVGLAAFLLKEKPKDFISQFEIVAKSGRGGIVLFSYDDITEEMFNYLANLNKNH
jgi:uncharacterized lipoprotein YddW (UPF0748 family)